MSLDGMRIEKIDFVSDGFKEILNSSGVAALITQHTDAVCARANANLAGIDSDYVSESEGFKSKVFQGGSQGRVVGTVYTTDRRSRIAESEYKALSRAVR